MRPPVYSIRGRVAAALVVTTLVFSACGTGGGSLPPTVGPASLVPATPSDTSQATPSPSAATSFVTDAPTLRTIADAPESTSVLTIGAQVVTNAAYASHAVTYTSDGLKISGVLLEPKAMGAHPGVVLVHGFVDPESYTSGSELPREQDALARAGYVVLYTDLRGLGGSDPAPAGPPDLDMGSVTDVINAVHALETSKLPSLDGKRIGLLGHSLGGLLVLDVLVAKPGLVDAGVTFAPSDVDIFDNVVRFLPADEPPYQAVVAAHGTLQTNPSYWKDLSPRTFVDRATAPLLIVHGDIDADNLLQSSMETEALWKAAGKDVRLLTLPGEDHVFQVRWQEAMDATIAFLAEHLGP